MNMEIVTRIISIATFLAIGTANITFILKTVQNQIKPNVVSWGAWAFACIVNSFSYSRMSGDSIVAFWTIASALMSGVMFICTIIKRGSYRFTILDVAIFILSIGATIVLQIYRDAKGASLILAMACAIPFVPTILGLRKSPENEIALPWIIFNVGHALVLTNVVLRWKGEWGNTAMPTIFFVGNLYIIRLLLIAKRRTPKFLKGDD